MYLPRPRSFPRAVRLTRALLILTLPASGRHNPATSRTPQVLPDLLACVLAGKTVLQLCGGQPDRNRPFAQRQSQDGNNSDKSAPTVVRGTDTIPVSLGTAVQNPPPSPCSIRSPTTPTHPHVPCCSPLPSSPFLLSFRLRWRSSVPVRRPSFPPFLLHSLHSDPVTRPLSNPALVSLAQSAAPAMPPGPTAQS